MRHNSISTSTTTTPPEDGTETTSATADAAEPSINGTTHRNSGVTAQVTIRQRIGGSGISSSQPLLQMSSMMQPQMPNGRMPIPPLQAQPVPYAHIPTMNGEEEEQTEEEKKKNISQDDDDDDDAATKNEKEGKRAAFECA
eukprot:10194060-Ditylum_brightwellii.AAC.1